MNVLHSIIISIRIMILYLLLDTSDSRAHTLMSGEREKNGKRTIAAHLRVSFALLQSFVLVCGTLVKMPTRRSRHPTCEKRWCCAIVLVGMRIFEFVIDITYDCVERIGQYDCGMTVRELVSNHVTDWTTVYWTHTISLDSEWLAISSSRWINKNNFC